MKPLFSTTDFEKHEPDSILHPYKAAEIANTIHEERCHYEAALKDKISELEMWETRWAQRCERLMAENTRLRAALERLWIGQANSHSDIWWKETWTSKFAKSVLEEK
jgi:flavin-dependent dehydrogenase